MPLISAIATGVSAGTVINALASERVYCCLILCLYGHPVVSVKSREQLLAAFRDAIKGHCGLARRDILHRDVGLHNIILGAPDAPDEYKGILVDHDLAPGFLRDPVDAYVDYRTGTRVYQSTQELKSFAYKNTALSSGKRLLYDYLDDLESFYWSLCWICFIRDDQPTIDDPKDWNADDPVIAGYGKCIHLLLKFYPSSVKEHFKAFIPLLQYLHAIFQRTLQKKSELIGARAAHTRDLATIRAEADATYREVIGMFDDTIGSLAEFLPAEEAPLPSASVVLPERPKIPRRTPHMLAPSMSMTIGNKRKASEESDEGPEKKRSQVASTAPTKPSSLRHSESYDP
ncbi:uncharacterized protein SCHCODRAFT_02633314 [Schizophyllum commune H4-8]|nr:uncharacterized protein SCHCODRAFT_02633314 [Schizophyllum commune H4-8]KAI5889007.1 hypothetical protein SCHCODRAFT_02633314 [Schizophyllum commune H4-8]